MAPHYWCDSFADRGFLSLTGAGRRLRIRIFFLAE